VRSAPSPSDWRQPGAVWEEKIGRWFFVAALITRRDVARFVRKRMTIPQAANLLSEFEFLVSRSSGPGGQNVNKVNSRITLKWNIAGSTLLTPDQKQILLSKLASQLTKDGVLMISVQDQRSQLQNKEAAIARLDELLVRALTPKKKRRPTKPSKSSSRKRVESKKKHSEKKQWRQKF
jgi:ribosome-associated protein